MNISKNRTEKEGQIAVVEELPDNIYSIRFILESLGYKVRSVCREDGYLDEIMKLSPDLIIVDMLIPAQGGLKAIAELKSSELKRVPGMAITADAVAVDEEVLLEAGFNDVLHKPYTVTQLQEKLGKYVG